jgi:uncharacterized protein YprB with RNaseH-like and TPR domain
MLRHTFCHLKGVALRKEQRLWSAGLTTWDDVLSGRLPAGVARRLPVEDLRESHRRHGLGEAGWFAARLPSAQSWRLFSDFREHCAYLDIETTGMSDAASVTTIALYDGRCIRTYVSGENLDAFARDVRSYRLLVTYNGKCFDLPILRRCLGCPLDQAHIDLRYVLAGLGIRGGLKGCERQVGIARPGLEEVDGLMAVLLWYDYQRRRDRRILDTLLAYNVQDTMNLETLLVHAHNAWLDRLAAPFLAVHRLAAASLPVNPYTADPDSVRRALRERERIYQIGVTGRFATGEDVPDDLLG